MHTPVFYPIHTMLNNQYIQQKKKLGIRTTDKEKHKVTSMLRIDIDTVLFYGIRDIKKIFHRRHITELAFIGKSTSALTLTIILMHIVFGLDNIVAYTALLSAEASFSTARNNRNCYC